MKNILITGGAGFIGSHIADYVANREESFNIILIDNFARAQFFNQISKDQIENNIGKLQNYSNLQFYEQDVKNPNFIKELFQRYNFDIIFHTASQTAVTYSVKNPYIDYLNNLDATINLLEQIRKTSTNPKLFYFSSNKVFGNRINDFDLLETQSRYEFKNKNFKGISEDFPVDQTHHSPYGASKLCSDLYIQEYGFTYGLDFIILRMSCIYGPRQLGIEAQGWVAHIIKNALHKKSIRIFGNGKQVRDILYISDLINCIEALLRSEKKREIFCIGGGINNTISLLELIAILENLLNQRIKYQFHSWREADQKIFISDIRKAQKTLNWTPKISPEKGIKKVIKWYKEINNSI